MTQQEIDDLFEEFEAIMIRKFPPEEYGEDSDCDVLMHIAETLRDEAKKATPSQFESQFGDIGEDNIKEQEA
jgi:hypothetical protein